MLILNITRYILITMSKDTANLVGVRFSPETLSILDEKRAEVGATRQEFIKMALFRALSA